MNLSSTDFYTRQLCRDYISGERLQSLCDFEWSPGINLPKSPCVVYVCGDDWSKAWREFGNNLDTKYILLTHNSDQNFTAGHEAELPPNVVRWFGQNMDVRTSRTQGVPIGIANSKWPHGNIDTIIQAIREANIETNQWFACFKIETNFKERLPVYQYTQSYPSAFIWRNAPIPHLEFLKKVRESFITLSPPGNGIDCHRTWETLYCERHPMTKESIAMSYFDDCNIMTYTDVSCIIPPKALKQNTNASMWLSTWEHCIETARENLL